MRNIAKMARQVLIKMWIDGHCYELEKINKVGGKNYKKKEHNKESPVYEFLENAEGKVSTTFKLPRPYYTQIWSNFQKDVKEMEVLSNTIICVPRSLQESSLLIIGDSKDDVGRARNYIHSIVGTLREQNTALQFISIPAVNEEIVTNFENFKKEILSGEKIDGMHESIFVSGKKLHLTVIVFALLDETEKQEAIKALQDYKSTILQPLIQKTGPLMIEFSGVDCMQSNLQKANVVYTNPKIINTSEVELQQIANGISDFFYERGLVQRYKENVKLHMTLMNTKYRNEDRNKKWKKHANRRLTFDASSIMKKYKDYYFGRCPLNKINLSLMSSVGEDGFYTSLATITI